MIQNNTSSNKIKNDNTDESKNKRVVVVVSSFFGIKRENKQIKQNCLNLLDYFIYYSNCLQLKLSSFNSILDIR